MSSAKKPSRQVCVYRSRFYKQKKLFHIVLCYVYTDKWDANRMGCKFRETATVYLRKKNAIKIGDS